MSQRTWLLIRNHLDAYINQHQNIEQNLHQKLTDLQKLMDQGISNVRDKSQFRVWIGQMMHNSTEISRLVDITPNTNPQFIYEQQTLNIKNDVDQISQKLIALSDAIHLISIDRLKQEFVFDDPESELEGFALVSQASPTPRIENASLPRLLSRMQAVIKT